MEKTQSIAKPIEHNIIAVKSKLILTDTLYVITTGQPRKVHPNTIEKSFAGT